MNVPEARPVYATGYENFKGVDFTSQKPARNRFPDACNIEITDHIKKRAGYKKVSIKCGGEDISEEIKVIKFMKFNHEPYYFVQAGSKLYMGKSFEKMEEAKIHGEASAVSSSEIMNFIECDNKVYVLTGEDIYEIAYREDVLQNDTDPKYTGDYYNYYYLNGGYYYVCTNSNNYWDDAEYTQLYYKIVNEPDFPVYSNWLMGSNKTIPSQYIKRKTDSAGTLRTYLCYVDIRRTKNQSYLTPDREGFAYIPCYAEGVGATGNTTEADYAQAFEGLIINEEINLLSRYRYCEYKYTDAPGGAYNYLLPKDYRPGTMIIVRADFKSSIDYIEIPASQIFSAEGFKYIKTSQIVQQGLSRIRIYYISQYAEESYNAHQINKSTIYSNMIYGNGNYYFLVGKEKKNTDYHSEVNDMTYFKGSSYQMYGNSDEILGYGQLGESLCVIKKNGSDNSMCLRTSSEVSGLGTVFPVSYALGGASLGISADSIKNFNGEVLYLSQTGIKAVTSLSTVNSKVTSDRSYYINGRLLKEEGLENAKCVIHKDKYYLGVNGNVYILDSTKPKDYINMTANEYSYEGLFWNNINASCFYSDGETLYFGGKNGGLFKFVDEYYKDDTEPVKCFICTVFDDDGDFMSLKKIKKKGTGVLAKPFSKSTIDIAYRYDDNNEKAIKTVYPQFFDFDNVDFARFSFYTSDKPQVIPFMKKSKKYKSLQIVLKSEVDEPFAFLGIIKRYEIVNFVKRM